MTAHIMHTDAGKYYLEHREYAHDRMQEDKTRRPTRKYPLYSRGEASQLTIFKSDEDSLTKTDTNPAVTTTETTNEIVATTNPRQLPEQPEILGEAQRYLRSCTANEPNTGPERFSGFASTRAGLRSALEDTAGWPDIAASQAASLTAGQSTGSTVSEESEHDRHSNRSIVDLQNADTEHTCSDNSMNAQEVASE